MIDHKMMANAIRILTIDAVERAQSGHPGMPMGMADIATVLWRQFYRHNPVCSEWWNRDRFVVSNGHGSMLLYALLHLSGYALTIEDIKEFRQFHSKTAGHPEYGLTEGVETTTGPLGQGLANAVGMAIAEKHLAACFNREDFPIIDHHTYVFASDGDLMEGVSHEVCSLAGTLGLSKLIVFWDDNEISIDGKTRQWFTDHTAQRFQAYGWQVVEIDGHNEQEIAGAIQQAQQEVVKPTLICCKTLIGFGSPTLAGTSDIHSDALGADEVQAVRDQLQWPYKPFEIPQDIKQAWDATKQGEVEQRKWNKLWSLYKEKHSELAECLQQRMDGTLNLDALTAFKDYIHDCTDHPKALATRKHSNKLLNKLSDACGELFGGSADLSGSNGTKWQGAREFSSSQPEGNYLHYGVREFGMTAIANGLALHGGIIPFVGTFLVFSDYARNAIRMAAIMKLRVVMVYTHDSIGVGEDGPTHQPIEHINSLRLIPDLHVWRPAEAIETCVAWRESLNSIRAPSALVLTRQTVPILEECQGKVEAIAKGGYVLWEADKESDAIIIATGSELHLALAAAKRMRSSGLSIRVVSMPCADIFLQQERAYRESILPRGVVARVAVEAGTSDFWWRFVGLNGAVIGIDTFGLSAPGSHLMKHFGFEESNVEKIVNEVTRVHSSV